VLSVREFVCAGADVARFCQSDAQQLHADAALLSIHRLRDVHAVGWQVKGVMYPPVTHLNQRNEIRHSSRVVRHGRAIKWMLVINK
jgi:hypothetical protein